MATKQKPKLDWTWEQGSWSLYLFSGALDCIIKEAMQPGGYGKWEVIIGCCTYSRQKGKYFDSADEAKIACEGLLLQIGQGVVGKLGGS